MAHSPRHCRGTVCGCADMFAPGPVPGAGPAPALGQLSGDHTGTLSLHYGKNGGGEAHPMPICFVSLNCILGHIGILSLL